MKLNTVYISGYNLLKYCKRQISENQRWKLSSHMAHSSRNGAKSSPQIC